MRNIYIIGGSPCAGKSTVAEILAKKYNLHYFKVDDLLDHYTKLGAGKGYPICQKTIEWSPEQIWMRNPTIQCEEEFEWYREFVPYILEGCSDKEKAFSNWMDRDILFAKEVQRQCVEEGYFSIINDGSVGVEKIVEKVERHFVVE